LLLAGALLLVCLKQLAAKVMDACQAQQQHLIWVDLAMVQHGHVCQVNTTSLQALRVWLNPQPAGHAQPMAHHVTHA
jgi:hypothetical protein